MHKIEVIHRDLKPGNILLMKKGIDNLDLRIADFGLSKDLEDPEVTLERCGTPTYIAPEILQGHRYDYKCDIFSLGSIMYNLLTGRYLFQSQGPSKALQLNKLCDLNGIEDHLKNVSTEAKELMY